MPTPSPAGLTAPIAIIGMSCRLPGGANSPEELWELLRRGGEAWSPVPETRYNEAAFYHPSADDPNGTNHHRGGHFIDRDLRDFDHGFFRLSPQQAAAMDPQQRVLLEMSYEVLEEAGVTLEACAGSSTAVYVASFTTDFERNLYRDPLDLPAYYLTGVETAILSNRISHAFDLRGPSMTVDTGCSGGMVALHQACMSLRNGESDAAIVGAANLTLGPDHHIGMSALHLISGTGRSFPFDVRGDGYGRGEGCAVFMVKRLDDAIRDGNPIKAVIRNTAVNQDGHTPASITYPNGAAQEQLIRDTYERVGLSPSDVIYVEAHGTGTVAGDFEELKAIDNVFRNTDGDRPQKPLYVGSIKGNIGHTENTSGLVSLVKAVLILNHLEIPPTAGLSEFKPGLPLERIRVPTQLLTWPESVTQDGEVPRVSINSFGFGGANAHAILERPPSPPPTSHHAVKPTNALRDGPRLFMLSAHNKVSLVKMIAEYHAWARSGVGELDSLSYTLCQRRSRLQWRYSCVVSDRESLEKILHSAMSSSQISKLSPVRDRPKLVFVFTGQGAQWLGMARELLTSSKVFLASIRSSRDILAILGSTWDLEEELLRPSGGPTRLNTAELAQPATTAIQIALVELLRALGLLQGPFAVVGHSSGEIAAAYSAGHLTARQALGIAFHRGFMAAAAKTRGLPRGAMLSVGLGESDALPFTKDLSKGIATIACVNSPESVTISGDAEAVDEISARIASHARDGETIFQRHLLVDTAYHSYHMRSVADEYRKRIEALSLDGACVARTDVSFFSSVTGTSKTSGFDAEYWTLNLVSPVRFCDAVERLIDAEFGARHPLSFVEVGPHCALAGPVRQCLSSQQRSGHATEYHSVLQRKMDARVSTLTLAGRLFELGFDVNFDEVSNISSTAGSATVLTNLPSYPWDHSLKHMFESRISREYRSRRDPYHDLLGVRSADATSLEPRWRHMIGLNTLPWLEHHTIDSQMIFPGSAYLCMAIEALRQLQRERHPDQLLETIDLRDVSFLRALVVPEAPQRTELQLSLNPDTSSLLGFQFRVSSLTDGEWHEHCSGRIEGRLVKSDIGEETERCLSMATTVQLDRRDSSQDQILGSEELYDEFSEAGNGYGSTFAGIRRLVLSAGAGLATVEIPNVAALMPAQHQHPHLIHPSTLDIILHTGLPLASRRLGKGSIMPVHIDELSLSATAAMPREPGSRLDVSTQLSGSQFRTAYTDLSVMASGREVLSASGIELRSLASTLKMPDGLEDTAGICYELDWRADIDFFEPAGQPAAPIYGDVVRQIMYKKGSLTVLNLSIVNNDPSLAFFKALTMKDLKKTVYELVSGNSMPPDELHRIRKQLAGYPVRYRSLNLGRSLSEQGFEEGHYDVVLVQEVLHLHHASRLVQSAGVVLLELQNYDDDSWRMSLSSASLEFRFSFHDAGRGSLVVVARPSRVNMATHSPPHVQIVTRSEECANKNLVHALENCLLASGFTFSRSTIQSISSSFSPSELENMGRKDCFVVVDDEDRPILSDPECFGPLVALLKQPLRIVWISPLEALPMHQITGVARTAHAENEELRLTLVHTASRLLANDLNCCIPQLGSILESAFSSSGPHAEREYRLDEFGTVLIPRLHRSLPFNHAIRSDISKPYGEIRQVSFADTSTKLLLPNVDAESDPPQNWSSFQASTSCSSSAVADEEIEVDTLAFGLFKPGSNTSHWVYAGVATRVGNHVEHLCSGDNVLALAPVPGANRMHIPGAHAARLPTGVSPSEGAGLLLHVMVACYALHIQAPVSAKSSVVVHDSLTYIGRAAVAIARRAGATVYVTADGPQEARSMTTELDLPQGHVITNQQACSSRNKWTKRFDVVLQAGQSELPAKLLAGLKPFGRVVVVAVDGPSSRKQAEPLTMPKGSRNQAIMYCDLIGLLREDPDMIPVLIRQATAILDQVSQPASDICIRPLTHLAEAAKLVETEVHDMVVLEVDAGSIVPALMPSGPDISWSENASYLITGGLGDLGQRLLSLMAKRGAKHLVSLSRRPVDVEEHDRLQTRLQLLSPDCRLYCVVCDITVEESIQNAAGLLDQLGVPPVRGIIQSAAILQASNLLPQDRTLDSMTYEDFLVASRVKVDGTLSLERIFASDHLQFFLMLSSAVNIVGASGQANYNAGNSVQDALARARNLPGQTCQYTSLSIGWIEDAVHTTRDEARLNGLRRAGLRAISHDELARYFDHALGAGSGTSLPAQAIIGFDAVSLSNATALNGNITSALFCHIRETDHPSTGDSATDSAGEGKTFYECMACKDVESAVLLVFTALKSHLARLISIPEERIDGNTSMLSVGVDSLVSIELRNWIVRQFDSPMQSSEILTDQTILALADKIVFRSRVASESTSREDSDDGSRASSHTSATTKASSLASKGSDVNAILEAPADVEVCTDLPRLPQPALEATLEMFEESRRAIDTPELQEDTAKAVQDFLCGPGPDLQLRLSTIPDSDHMVSEAYERHVYLSRREPLQDYSQFSVGHTLKAPQHSQAARATILTVSAMEFARQLAQGGLPSDVLQGEPIHQEARAWMFYATRRPHSETDTMERHAPNQTIAVLRRGHVFQLTMPSPDETIVAAAVHSAYEAIIKESERWSPSLATLTSETRPAWADMRRELERHPDNAFSLSVMDTCAFVVCLDDESPCTAGERHMQFLLNGKHRPLSNRWQDKPVQLAVTANGLSAGIFEHSKLDGMDVRSLTSHLTRALFASPGPTTTALAYPVRKLEWNIQEPMLKRVSEVQARAKNYGVLDHCYVDAASLGITSLRRRRAPPHATVHLAVLLAVYLVDKSIRPAWEIASLARFARGRIDWVQTVTVPVRAFIEAAATTISSQRGLQEEARCHVRGLFDAAAADHASLTSAASVGLGYVSGMYALLAMHERQNESESETCDDDDRALPALFRSPAWKATRRGGPGQDLKIGFMPSEGDDDDEWDEGGFLVGGDRGVYVHCRVQAHQTRFAISARPEYAAQVSRALSRTADFLEVLLV